MINILQGMKSLEVNQKSESKFLIKQIRSIEEKTKGLTIIEEPKDLKKQRK